MISIACPTDDVKTIFEDAVKLTRNVALRKSLLSESKRVVSRAKKYVKLAKKEKLHTLVPENTLGVDKNQLANVYDRVLVKGKMRAVYDKIKSAAKLQICPSCGERTVGTLDHYLPQSEYPELSVFTSNLVPCCTDCNKVKLSYTATSHSKQLFHPYFDNWTTHRVLRAHVAVGAKVDVSFSITTARGLPTKTLERVKNHFSLLELANLYAAKAAADLIGSKGWMQSDFSIHPQTLRNGLLKQAQSWDLFSINHWKSALYWSLYRSRDFYTGGVNLLD